LVILVCLEREKGNKYLEYKKYDSARVCQLGLGGIKIFGRSKREKMKRAMGLRKIQK